MSRRPARGYYRVQWSGKFWDVWRTDRHPRGVELMGGWFTLARAGDAARALAAADHAEGESESPAHKYAGFLRWLEEMRAVNHAYDHRGVALAYADNQGRIQPVNTPADTLRQVREALDRVNQECGRYPTPAPGQRHSPYNAGYLDGLDTAHTWINEALGGTP